MKTLSMGTKIITGVLGSVLAFSVYAADRELVKKPARAMAKPDLIVYYVNSYYPEDNKIKVTIRNNGKAKAGSSVVTVYAGGMSAEASVPSLDSNHAAERVVKFNKPLKKGTKMRVVADSKKHVSESNENNNTKSHTY